MAELTIKANGLIDNHTARRLAPVIPTPESKDANDIVEYGVRQKVKKVGEGEYDFILEDEVYEVSRVNRQAWIAKDAEDVGVLNILEKVRRSGDMSLLNQTGSVIPEGLQDYTNVPSSIGEALQSIKTGSNSFESLKNIFGDVTFEQLANMSEDQIAAAVQEYVASKQPKVEEKGDK